MLPFEYVDIGALHFGTGGKTNPVQLIEKQQERYVSSQRPPLAPQQQQKGLDEEAGLAILKLIYQKSNGGGGGVWATIDETEEEEKKKRRRRQASEHKNTFYMGEEKQLSAQTQRYAVLERFTDLLGVESRANVKYINKRVLHENRITVKDLIVKCRVSMTELKGASVLNSFQDLVDLGFVVKDLVRDRQLFDVNKLQINFGATYRTMVQHNVVINILDLLRCQFFASELQTMNFPFADFLLKNSVLKEQLKQLNFALADLVMLGFSRRHLRKMEISEEDALRYFKWDKREYNKLVEKRG